FVDRETGELHPRTDELIEQVAQKIEVRGIEAWFDLDPVELLGAEAEQYEKATDILDVWFDSGVTHTSVLQRRSELGFPADLYLEGSDQHRGWFHSSLLTSVAMYGHAPYRGVLTHGFTVDAKGRKMSKSTGNVVAPQQVIDRLGADVLRLWVAATDYRAEMNISDEILKRIADAYRRIRNTVRFLLANLDGFDAATDLLPPSEMLALDRWVLQRLSEMQHAIDRAYDNYQFHQVYQMIHNFCVGDLGGFYLDIIKDRQYTTQADSVPRRSAQSALHHVAESMVRWLAPILSYTAEEIWQTLPGERAESVFLELWHELPEGLAGEQMDLAYWARIRQVRESVSKQLEILRAEGTIGAPLDAEIGLYCDPELYAMLEPIAAELRFILITSEATLSPAGERPVDAVAAEEIPGLWLVVTASELAKCGRCWHHRADVGSDARHPELCGRCVTNVEGDGEQRLFA
ncbi:MAG: class I tRNA ligase family protein, partial [Gammaproteobacteria bacterium]|nr:class I tRNA ligase family protein [Gammaproteobacteria bacterium]